MVSLLSGPKSSELQDRFHSNLHQICILDQKRCTRRCLRKCENQRNFNLSKPGLGAPFVVWEPDFKLGVRGASYDITVLQ